jgi:hypothetical protein
MVNVLKRFKVVATLTGVDGYGKYRFMVVDEKSKEELKKSLGKYDRKWADKQLYISEKTGAMHFALKTNLTSNRAEQFKLEFMDMLKEIVIDLYAYEWEGRSGFAIKLFNGYF